MSLYDKASLIQIPSGYKAGKLYSAIPNSGAGDFTVTGDAEGDATRVNSQGLIETVNANVPRLDYPFIDGVVQDCPHLLLEPQRTNSQLYSEDFINAAWNKINTTIISDDTISPSGELNADKFARTSTSGSWMVQSISKGATATTYTTSAFIKKGSDNYFAARAQGSYPSRLEIRFRFDTEEIYYAQAISGFVLLDYGVENYVNDWYRIYFTYTTDTHTSLSIMFSPRATNGNIDSSDTSSSSYAYIWGAQTEQGSYPTSYIQTEGSAVTRLKDTCLNAGNSNLFNDSEGTLFVDWKGFQAGVIDRRMSLSDTSNNVVSLDLSSVSDRIKGSIYDGTNLRNFLSYGHTHTDRNKIAIRYKSGDSKMFVNGIEVASTTGTFSLNGLSTLSFSSRNQFAQFFEGEVYQTMVFNEALSDSELETLTTL
jgi:hypothetical protein